MSPDALPQLAEVQRRFRDAVLGTSDAPLSPMLRADQSDIAARIAIYRTTVQQSLVDALATAFAVTSRIIGVRDFTALALRFVVTTPPHVPQLSSYGAGFSEHIARDGVMQRAPYLADVASLEWARAECYFAADAKELDPIRLTQLAEAEIERVKLALHPATRLVKSTFPILHIWEINQPEVTDVPPLDVTQGQTVLVTRVGARLVMLPLEPADAALVSAIAAGRTLGEAAEEALTAQPSFDLQGALQRHFINHAFRDAVAN